MDRPTAAEVLPRSELLQARFPDTAPPDPPPEGDEANPNLVILVEDANVWVEQTVKRIPLETAVPAGLERVALQAVTLKTEEFAEQRKRQIANAMATGSHIRSFTAGSYSETRFDYGAARKAGMLSPNLALHEALRLLMDDEAFEEWLAEATGKVVPESAAVAFDWNRDGRIGPPRPY